MLRNSLFVVVCLPLLFACAGLRQEEKNDQRLPKNNSIPAYRTGIIVKEAADGLFVSDFENEFPGKAAGMRSGDLIVSVNGKKRSNKEFIQLMNVNRGEDILFTVKRNGQMLDYTITPLLYFRLPPSTHKLYELLDVDGQNVKLAVVVTDVRNDASERNYAWEESMRRQVQGATENHLLNHFDRNDKFSLVDNLRLNNILDEYRLNMTGLASDAARAKIGAMTGATHLLVVTLVRHPKRIKQKESCEDDGTASLLEIGSGKVLASDQSVQECK